jgi:ubiquinone/menaquinone biosynthesis C-methylase UbiE
VSDNLKLLPQNALLQTGPVDHADWNYRPLLGAIQRARFRMVLRLLPGQRVPRLLEIGYGSGVFLPTLHEQCDELHALDIHGKNREVTQKLKEHGVHAELRQSSCDSTDYPDNHFDCAVAVSALEFVDRLDDACLELRRVLKPGGCLVAVTPGASKVLDWGLKVLTGKNGEDDFAGRRQRIIPTLTRHFAVERTKAFPMRGLPVRMYTALRLRKRPTA